MAILSSVSSIQNPVTSQNLKQVQKQAKQQHDKHLNKQRQKARKGSKSQSDAPTSFKREAGTSFNPGGRSQKSLHISHGKPQSVTVDLLLEGLQASTTPTHKPFYNSAQSQSKAPVKQKRKIDSDSSESEIDPVTVDNESSPALTLSGHKTMSTFYGAAIAPVPASSKLGLSDNKPPTSLMVHINNRLVTPPGDSISPTGLASLSQSEMLRLVDRDKEGSLSASRPKKKKKKKHKKRLKVDRDYEEEEEEEEPKAATVGHDGLLKLRITLKK